MDRMVKSFNKLQNDIPVPVMVGHDEIQMYKRAGGPACGWVTKIWRNGTKLMALLEYVPYKIYNLIDKRAYTAKSIGFGFDYVDKTGELHTDVLLHLALLGEEMPEVQTINDTGQLYSLPEYLKELITEKDFPAYHDIFTFSGRTKQQMKHKSVKISKKKNNIKFKIKDGE